MTDDAWTAALAAAMILSGLTFGLLYFAALKRAAVLLASGGGWTGPLGLTLGRIGAAVIFLSLAARLGAAALLAAFLGFLLARTLALHVVRRTD
jgi:N-ATPase, AtpR subunit